MRIKKLELTNYKCFEHLVLDKLGDRVVLVGPNGCGKSAVLEAIAFMKEYVGTYVRNHREFGFDDYHQYQKSWNMNFPIPVRGDANEAVITAHLSLNEPEQRIMQSRWDEEHEGPSPNCDQCTVIVRIRRSGSVMFDSNPSSQHEPLIVNLFEHYDPNSGAGVVDYIGADRKFPLQRIRSLDLSTLSLEQQRKERIELFTGVEPYQKFQSIKQFIISEQLNDLSIRVTTGVDQDSIGLLRDIFYDFFGPKRLIGSMQRGGEFQVVVGTLNGDHDIDQLSSGEMELFMVFVHLFRIRHLPSVILYDEPERHLNPGLESKLIPALDRLSTQNQLFIATHSTELIGSVPMQEIIALKREAGSSQPERFRDPTKTDRVRLFEVIGVKIGLQLASNRVVFLEGEKSSTDKKLLDRLAGPMLPGVLFVASGGTTDVIGSGTRASLLIEEASKDAAFLMVLDRDFRSDAGVVELRRRLNDRVFIWSCHEVENLLLTPEILLQVLRFNGVTVFADVESLKAGLQGVAASMAGQFVNEWAAYRIRNSVNIPPTGSPKDETNLRSMLTTQRERHVAAYSDHAIDAALTEARTEIATCLANDTWIDVLPGKEILDRFRSQYIQQLDGDLLRQQIISKMLESKTLPNQVVELCRFVQSK